jgi:uncharacterized protein YndB with AHSA1/START domain
MVQMRPVHEYREAAMAREISISVTARSAGPRPEVYRLLSDGSTWPQWTPFTDVAVIEQAPGGGEGVGAVRETRFRAMRGRERIVALTPDRQMSYTYIKGVLTPYIRDYVAVVDLEDDGAGTSIRWHSTFHERFPGAGWFPRRSLQGFLQKCVDGLAAAAAPTRAT